MDVRGDFPILKRKINGRPLVYFDNAATTQKPVQVLEAVDGFYRAITPIGPGVHSLAREATMDVRRGPQEGRRFINASPEEIIFTSNATQGLNMGRAGSVAGWAN